MAECYEDDELRNTFLELVTQLLVASSSVLYAGTKATFSVVEQPFKTPFVAAIIVVASPQRLELGEQIVAKFVTNLQGYLRSGCWREVKLVLRLLACLQGLLEGDGVFPILEELFSRAVDLQTASSEDVSIGPRWFILS